MGIFEKYRQVVVFAHGMILVPQLHIEGNAYFNIVLPLQNNTDMCFLL